MRERERAELLETSAWMEEDVGVFVCEKRKSDHVTNPPTTDSSYSQRDKRNGPRGAVQI